jgi:hypothetical protein
MDRDRAAAGGDLADQLDVYSRTGKRRHRFADDHDGADGFRCDAAVAGTDSGVLSAKNSY